MLAPNTRHYGIRTENSISLTLRFFKEFPRSTWNHQAFGKNINETFLKQFNKMSYANTIINAKSERSL